MSGFKIETIPNAPIMVVTTGSEDPGDQTRGMTENIPKVLHMLDQQPAPVFVIVDMRRLQRDLDGHLKASNIAARGQNPILHHPKVRETVFVSTDRLMTMVIKGLATATFGFARVNLFATREEALAYCHRKAGRPYTIDDEQTRAG